MHRLAIAVFILALSGCQQTTRVVTERDARLISIARSAAIAEGLSLTNAIYQVRRDGEGWIVEVSDAPDYTGVGEPVVTLHRTFFVKLGADEQVHEIHTHARRITPTTRPSGGA
jgi:hypothetical protein